MTQQTSIRTQTTLETALELHALGYAVLPACNDTSKAPGIAFPFKWENWRTTPPDTQQLQQWFGNGHPGIGIITGSASGNLALLEVEGRAADQMETLADVAAASGLGDLWQRLCNGWLERSPSGGWHWFARLEATPPESKKLATRPSTPEELAADPKNKRQTLAETKAEPGFAIVWPSGGPVHPTGGQWERIDTTGPATVPTISLEEYQAFCDLLATLAPEPAEPETPRRQESRQQHDGDELRPGVDYEQRTDWAEILEPHGWKHLYTKGSTRYWQRPGKNVGPSATTGRAEDRDRLYVFSSSTDFDTNTPITKFGAYAVLEHGGDFTAAASALGNAGYGERRQPDPTAAAADCIFAAVEPEPPAEPWEAGQGAEILDQVQTFLERFIAYPTPEAARAHTLWVAHAHLIEAFENTPRLAFLSPEPGSGKSRAMELTEPLVPRPVLSINSTVAYVFRKISDQAGKPTLLMDEIDAVFSSNKSDGAEDLRGLLNSGYRAGATAGRAAIKGKEIVTEEWPSYCAVALAGLNQLPDTLMTRSIVVHMKRRRPDQRIEPYRRRTTTRQAQELHDQLAAFAAAHFHQVRDAWPDLPPGIEDRDADVWEPLLSVADAAGGHWPDTARAAALVLVKEAQQKPATLGIRLLSDIRDIMADYDRISTQDLLTELHSIDTAPWGNLKGEPIDARFLARTLGKYEIPTNNTLRVGYGTAKGYLRSHFADAWERYLPAVTDTAEGDVTDPVTDMAGTETGDKPHETRPVTDVTDVTDPRHNKGAGYLSSPGDQDPDPVIFHKEGETGATDPAFVSPGFGNKGNDGNAATGIPRPGGCPLHSEPLPGCFTCDQETTP